MDALSREVLIEQHQQELRMESAERRLAALIVRPPRLGTRLRALVTLKPATPKEIARERWEGQPYPSLVELQTQPRICPAAGHPVLPCRGPQLHAYNGPCTRSSRCSGSS